MVGAGVEVDAPARPPRARPARARGRAAPRGRRTAAAASRPRASVAASGGNHRPVSASRRPSRNTIRRADRRRLAEQDLLLDDGPGQGDERVGLAERTEGALGAQRGPDERVVAEARVERPQVVVDGEGEAHAPDGRPGRGPRVCAGADQHLVGRVWATRMCTGSCSSPGTRRCSTVPRARASPSGLERSGKRKHQGGSISSRCSITSRLTRWTSTRNDRLETICQHLAAAAGGALAPAQRLAPATAADDRHRRRAGHEAGRRDGGRLHHGTRGQRLDRLALGEDREGVDDFLLLGRGHEGGSRNDREVGPTRAPSRRAGTC